MKLLGGNSFIMRAVYVLRVCRGLASKRVNVWVPGAPLLLTGRVNFMQAERAVLSWTGRPASPRQQSLSVSFKIP
jgi:hypothetical protein